jgi:hypothetical protein
MLSRYWCFLDCKTNVIYDFVPWTGKLCQWIKGVKYKGFSLMVSWTLIYYCYILELLMVSYLYLFLVECNCHNTWCILSIIGSDGWLWCSNFCTWMIRMCDGTADVICVFRQLVQGKRQSCCIVLLQKVREWMVKMRRKIMTHGHITDLQVSFTVVSNLL